MWLSTVLLCCSLTATAQKTTQPGDISAPFSTRATHLLGFANTRNNSTGTLSVQEDSLQFQENGYNGHVVVPTATPRYLMMLQPSAGAGGTQIGDTADWSRMSAIPLS